MKIFHLHQNYNFQGGAEQYVIQLSRELKKKGHNSVVGYSQANEKTVRNSKSNSYYLPYAADWDLIMAPVNRRQLSIALKHESPDIVHIHNIRNPDVTAIARKACPTVRFVHDPSMVCPTHWKLKPDFSYCNDPFGSACHKCMASFPWWERWNNLRMRKKEISETSQVDAVIVASRQMKLELAKAGVKEEKIHVIPYFAYQKEIPDGVKEENGLVVFVGTVHRIKGVDVLLRAMSGIKGESWRLAIVGDGPEINEMKSLAKELNIDKKVTFTGWIDNREVREWMLRASIVTVPSVWLEGFAIVGLEAMRDSKPVVGSKVGGITEWLSDGENGLLVTPGNDSELATAIETLLGSEKMRRKFGERGREIFTDKFTVDNHMDKMLSIYESIKKEKNVKLVVKENLGECFACRSGRTEYAFEKSGYSFKKCLECGFITTSITPDAETLASHYNDAYGDGEQSDLFKSEGFKRDQAAGRLETLKEITKPGLLLDVGSSFGFFIDEARKRNWKATGLEISEKPFEYSTTKLGLDVKRTGLDKFSNNGELYDLVTMWDVLEHLPEPEKALQLVSAMVKPGGIVGLSVPNGDSWLFGRIGKYWDWVIPPFHLHFFTVSSLYPLLERHGFKVTSITSSRGDSDNEWLLFMRYLLSKCGLGWVMRESIQPYIRNWLNNRKALENKLERYNAGLNGSELLIWVRKV